MRFSPQNTDLNIRWLICAAGVTLVWGSILTTAGAPGATIPFLVDASENVSAEFTGAPRLQSFVSAQWDGKWIFIAGRTGGYHGVGQGDVDFPRTKANLQIWVIEPL